MTRTREQARADAARHLAAADAATTPRERRNAKRRWQRAADAHNRTWTETESHAAHAANADQAARDWQAAQTEGDPK